MKRATYLAPLASIALFAAPALASARAPTPEASIAFADQGGVDDWRAVGDSTIYFKDQHRRWYRAELFGPAFDLPYVEHIGIDARPGGTLDRFGAIVVKGRRYAFRSFERAAGPPVKVKRHKA